MQASMHPLLNRAVLSNPYPLYAQLREAGAVHYVEAPLGAYLLTRYEDLGPVLKNPAHFSSRGMDFSQRTSEKLRPEVRQLVRTEHSLLASDPPVHGRLRQLVGRAFTARRVADLEPRVRTLARELLEQMRQQPEPELMGSLAATLPVIVIAELLGVEPERREDFKRWSDDAIDSSSLSLGNADPTRLEDSILALHAYMAQAIEERRRAPRPDLISALVEAAAQEDFLTASDLIHFCRLLLIAGNETTTNLLGNAVLALLRHPEQWERLVADPTLVPGAVEEVLRHDSPVQALLRQTTQPVEVAGRAIPQDARVMLMIGSAHRDPRRYTDPDRFDITRDAQGHYALGHGIHHCLGAPLARLEARVVLEELIHHVRRLDFAPGQEATLEWGNSLFVRGPRSLRLRLEWRA